MLIQRHRASLCRTLGLKTLGYEFPLFHFAIGLALVSILLRLELSTRNETPYTAHAWLPLSLSVLSLVILRAYPRRACVHASLAFLTWSAVATLAPSLTSVCFLTFAVAALGLVLVWLERLLRAREPALCAHLGIVDAGYSSVVNGWSWALFGLAMAVAIVVIGGSMSQALVGQGPALAVAPADWWAMLATLGVFGAFLASVGSDPDAPVLVEPEHVVLSLHWLSVAVLWWLGVASSPLLGRLVTPAVYYPLSTAIAALATAQLVRRYAHPESWHLLGWLTDLRSASLGRTLSFQACFLAILAVLFTKGSIEPLTVATLGLASATLGLVTLSTGWEAAGLAGSVAWSAAWSVAALVAAPRLGWTAGAARATAASVGLLFSAYPLWALAGWLRSDRALGKRRVWWALDSSGGRPSRIGAVLEVAAFGAALIAAAAAMIAGSDPATLGAWGTGVGVAVLLSAALLFVLLVPRWQAEWVIYLAQATILGAYVDYRMAFPQPIWFDSIVLTLMGYLDLGIAEVLERLNLKLYARPVRHFSLLLPLLPLCQLIWGRGIDDLSLFHLLAAGAFYSVACAQLRWKSLGYAAGVFYNAGLWLLWSRAGWQLSETPQLFLVPVGFSTILFAEANRELGRSAVNAIRTVGLTVIYASLALPIWQHQSFGAWVTLLACSLAGVFLGIGLRLQTFLWMGLATFVLDVVYEMWRVSLDFALAKWAIMLSLGIALVLFVALNEKKRIVDTMRLYLAQARSWE